MIYYTTKNALPVKQKMKNAFCENHIFTRFNLPMMPSHHIQIMQTADHIHAPRYSIFAVDFLLKLGKPRDFAGEDRHSSSD